jgi:hypothetical protein
MSDETAGVELTQEVDPLAGIESESSETVEAPQAAEPSDQAQKVEQSTEGDKEATEKKSREARARERSRLEIESRDKIIAELRAQLNPALPTLPNANPDKEPQVTDYPDVLDYLKAHQKWEAQEAIKQFQENQKKEAETKASETEKAKKVDAYNERLKPVLEQIPDLPDRVTELAEQGLITPQLENAVLDSPMGELLTVYFLQNPQELVSMRGLNEAQTYRQVALVEAKLQGQISQPVAASKKTNAAAPINPIGKKSTTATKSPDEMSQEEFYQLEAKLKKRS